MGLGFGTSPTRVTDGFHVLVPLLVIVSERGEKSLGVKTNFNEQINHYFLLCHRHVQIVSSSNDCILSIAMRHAFGTLSTYLYNNVSNLKACRFGQTSGIHLQMKTLQIVSKFLFFEISKFMIFQNAICDTI